MTPPNPFRIEVSRNLPYSDLFHWRVVRDGCVVSMGGVGHPTHAEALQEAEDALRWVGGRAGSRVQVSPDPA